MGFCKEWHNLQRDSRPALLWKPERKRGRAKMRPVCFSLQASSSMFLPTPPPSLRPWEQEVWSPKSDSLGAGAPLWGSTLAGWGAPLLDLIQKSLKVHAYFADCEVRIAWISLGMDYSLQQDESLIQKKVTCYYPLKGGL